MLAKRIAIAITMLCGKSVAILIAIHFSGQYCNTMAILFAILHYPLPPSKCLFFVCTIFHKFWVDYRLCDNVFNPKFKQ